MSRTVKVLTPAAWLAFLAPLAASGFPLTQMMGSRGEASGARALSPMLETWIEFLAQP